jgi:multidrug efflux pump subunit AcrA (membrane-fusion protein)
VLEVQARLDQNLAEAEALAAIDPALAAQLKAQESEIATRLEAIRNANEQRRALGALRKAQADAAERRAAEERAAAQAAAQAGSLGPATGSLSTVACPGGGSCRRGQRRGGAPRLRKPAGVWMAAGPALGRAI